MTRRRAGGRPGRQRRNRHHRTHHARPHRTHQRRRHRRIGRRVATRANGSGGVFIQGADGGAFPRGWTWACIIGSLCLFIGLGLTISYFVYFSRFENFTYLVAGIILSIFGGILTVVSVCTCMKSHQPITSRTIEARVQPLTNQQPPLSGINEEYPTNVVHTPYTSQIIQHQTDAPPNYLDYAEEFTTATPVLGHITANAPGYENATAPPPSYEQAVK